MIFGHDVRGCLLLSQLRLGVDQATSTCIIIYGIEIE